ncbi:hypothetical protein JCM10207_003605 [Rhodosporidiobolus poonsookiae]
MPGSSSRPPILLLLVPFALLFYLSFFRSSPTSPPHHHTANPKQPVQQQQQQQQQQVIAQDTAPGYSTIKSRLVAVGDIHGDLPHLTKLLRRADIIDLKGQWVGGETILVQTGDIVDRGKDTIAIYRFFQSLRAQADKAGGAVVSLLGNHEIMNALGDWRYVTKEDIASFGGERNRREAMLTGWIGQEWRTNYSINARVPALIDSFPPGAPVESFPSVPLGSTSDRRFVREPASFLVDDAQALGPFASTATHFVHGGVTDTYLAALDVSNPISKMNEIGSDILHSLLQSPAAPLGLPRGATPEQRLFWSEDGPMWSRIWAIDDEDEICERVESVTRSLRVRRLVMGHTPQFKGIMTRCGGKIVLIDTGISRAYGGPLSALSITYTLTPPSSLALPDALSFGIVDLSDPNPEETLARTPGRGETVKWVEREVVEAMYTGGRETVELDRRERVVELVAP